MRDRRRASSQQRRGPGGLAIREKGWQRAPRETGGQQRGQTTPRDKGASASREGGRQRPKRRRAWRVKGSRQPPEIGGARRVKGNYEPPQTSLSLLSITSSPTSNVRSVGPMSACFSIRARPSQALLLRGSILHQSAHRH